MPTQHGEAAVIRLLPRERGLLEVAKLGLSAADEAKLMRMIALPHGMIVVTGPTGSGKTTTLATMLTLLNETTRKILTIEDPVEYEIHGVNQTQVKPSIGLTFSNALRSFVRQDPDVIMVGEVRDAETANIAIHASLTGHLVLTTLHTETAPAAVPRLLDLGVEGFLLKSTLRGVIAQRLVRILCDRCKERRTLRASDLSGDPRYQALGFRAGDTIHEPAGCERCGGTGYRGRTGVFEIIEMTDDVRKLISLRHQFGRRRTGGGARRHDHHDRRCHRQMSRRSDIRVRGAPRHHGAVTRMPNFRYRALTQAGEMVSGSISAPDASEVAHRIEYLGLVPIDTVTRNAAMQAPGSASRAARGPKT